MNRKLLSNVIVAVFAVATAVLAWLALQSDTEEMLDPQAISEAQNPPPEAVEEAEPEDERLPDLILITIDTLRVDHLGAYGYAPAKTPTLDKLAGEGVRFAEATVPFPRTTPAMASLFTGLWPQHHGSREVWERIQNGKLLTEVLVDAGYDTIGVSANSACGPRQKFDRGFRQFRHRKQLGRHDADRVTRKALTMLEKADPDKPLFLWAHYVDPHWPYEPPKIWKDQPEAPKCRQMRADTKTRKIPMGHLLSNEGGVAEPVLEDCIQLYDSEIAFADSEIAKLIAGLQEAGRWDDAIVVFTADHGENMGEDNYWFGHGPSVHDASMRVPLVFKGPGIPAGKVDDGIARIEDVMPTVLDLLGIDEDERPPADGFSLRWRWDPQAPRPTQPIKVAFAESGTPLRALSDSHLVSGRHGQYCIHDERYSICKEREVRDDEPATEDDEREDERAEHEDAQAEAEAANEDAARIKGDAPGPAANDPAPGEEAGPGATADAPAPGKADEAPPAVTKDPPKPPPALVIRFYDRKRDPEFKSPLERVPSKIRTRLEKAMEVWKPESARQRTVRTPQFKVVDYPQLEGGYRRELYDLTADPGATKNVWNEHPRIAAELAELLERWAADMPLYEARERTEEEIEELRSLGYIR